MRRRLPSSCQEWTGRLVAWIADAETGETPGVPRFDGTSLPRPARFPGQARSPFTEVKANTRRTYTDSLNLIERTVGKRLRARPRRSSTCSTGMRSGASPPAGGRERIDRAHNGVSTFRMVINFCGKLKPQSRYADCRALAEDMRKVKFERGAAVRRADRQPSPRLRAHRL